MVFMQVVEVVQEDYHQDVLQVEQEDQVEVEMALVLHVQHLD